MIDAYKKFWKNYANFNGRSSRSDYWWVALINFVISLLLTTLTLFIVLRATLVVDTLLGSGYSSDELVVSLLFQEVFSTPMNTLVLLLSGGYGATTFIPNLAITVRRLRDAGFHWAFIFAGFVPIGWLLLLILLVQKTKEEDLTE